MARQVSRANDSGRGKIKPLAAHSVLGFEAEGLGCVCQELRPRELALYQYGLAEALLGNNVRYFTSCAVLLGEDNSALVITA